jgi:hypothetical protein
MAMKRTAWREVAIGAGLILTALGATTRLTETQAQHLEQFSAFAVNLQGTRPGDRSMSGIIQITIDRWSTEEERNTLIDAFDSKGQNGLLNQLARMKPTGYIKLPTTLGYDLRYTREVRNPDGSRRIIVGTDRRMTVNEEINRPITTDYPFTIIELRVNKANMGEGRLSALTKIKTNKKEGLIELEAYGDAAKLTEVKPLQ